MSCGSPPRQYVRVQEGLREGWCVSAVLTNVFHYSASLFIANLLTSTSKKLGNIEAGRGDGPRQVFRNYSWPVSKLYNHHNSLVQLLRWLTMIQMFSMHWGHVWLTYSLSPIFQDLLGWRPIETHAYPDMTCQEKWQAHKSMGFQKSGLAKFLLLVILLWLHGTNDIIRIKFFGKVISGFLEAHPPKT